MAPRYPTFGDVPNPPLRSSRAAVLLALSGGGRGPGEIKRASGYVELYDEELDRQPADLGLHTVPRAQRLEPGREEEGAAAVLGLHRAGAFPVVIGDGRGVSAAALSAGITHRPGADPVLLAGTPPPEPALGAMLRAAGGATLKLIGLKSPPRRPAAGTALLAPARALWSDSLADPWAGASDRVHLSIHPDFLEPAALPAAYNTEPGGLDWWRALGLLRNLFAGREVVGLDLCGHAPTRGKVIPDFVLAKLLYKAIGYKLCLDRR